MEDVLTLTVPGRGSVTGADGTATLRFFSGACDRFDVEVTGTDVDLVAVYDVDVIVTRGT